MIVTTFVVLLSSLTWLSPNAVLRYPRRIDLLKRAAQSNLPYRSLKEMQQEVDLICGGPPAPQKTNKAKIVACREMG